MLSGVLFGCVPAWQATRTDANEVLKESGRSISGGRNTFRRALVVAEFALALALLAGGGLAVHSLVNLANVDMGFRSDHLLTFNVPMSGDRYDGAERVTAFTIGCSNGCRLCPASHRRRSRRRCPCMERASGCRSPSSESPCRIRRSGLAPVFRSGDARILQDARDRDPERPRVHGAGHGQLRPRCHRQRHVREALLQGCGSAHAAPIDRTIDSRCHQARTRRRVAGRRRIEIRTQRGPRDGDFPEIDVPYAQSPWPGGGVRFVRPAIPKPCRRAWPRWCSRWIRNCRSPT